MKEVKTPKKPLAIYYAIVLLVLMLLNFVLVPWMSERQVKEVDYGTFMSMTEDKDIGRVDVESNQIIFTDKDEKQIYKTGLMNDPDLTQRLYDAGAEFSSEIVEQASPLMSFLLSFVLPIVLFVWLGNFMNKKPHPHPSRTARQEDTILSRIISPKFRPRNKDFPQIPAANASVSKAVGFQSLYHPGTLSILHNPPLSPPYLLILYITSSLH